MNRRNTLTAALFLAFLAAGIVLFGASTVKDGFLRAQLAALRKDPSGLAAFLDGDAESAINQDLDRSHIFIQLFGGVQRLTGRRVVEDVAGAYNVARLDNGTLNFVSYVSQSVDIGGSARKTADFQQRLAEKGVPFVFVLAPQKIQRGTDPLPVSLRNTANDSADRFLHALQDAGCDSIDLRPLFEGMDDYAACFFRTDHHWKPEAAFAAWGYLAEALEHGYGLHTTGGFTAPEQWETTVLKDFFLGSQGKRVGTLYAGLDDITLYTPKFDTDLTYSCEDYGFTRTGPFAESVCFPERVEQKDLFGGNPYTYYAGGDYPVATIVNHRNPDGPKILLVRESFACALTPFLSLSCSELTTVDLRYYEGDVMDVVEQVQPDLVMTLYNAGTCEAPDLFAFDGAK